MAKIPAKPGISKNAHFFSHTRGIRVRSPGNNHDWRPHRRRDAAEARKQRESLHFLQRCNVCTWHRRIRLEAGSGELGIPPETSTMITYQSNLYDLVANSKDKDLPSHTSLALERIRMIFKSYHYTPEAQKKSRSTAAPNALRPGHRR